jgi:hypothetical protein
MVIARPPEAANKCRRLPPLDGVIAPTFGTLCLVAIVQFRLMVPAFTMSADNERRARIDDRQA